MKIKNSKIDVYITMTSAPHFPVQLSLAQFEEAASLLKKDGRVNLTRSREPIKEYTYRKEDGLDELRNRRMDLVVLVQGAFTWDNVMLKILDTFGDAPVLLWALEELPFDSGSLERNSLCGTMMNAATLKRIGRTIFYIYGNPEREEAREKLNDIITSIYAKKMVEGSTFGAIGSRPPGFYSSTFDEREVLRRFSIRTVHGELLDILDRYKNVEDEDVKKDIGEMMKLGEMGFADDKSNEESSRLFLAIKQFIGENEIDYLGIKCWPELMRRGLNTCMVNGRLIDIGIMTGCENDFYGTLTMYIYHLLTGTSPWFADLIHIDRKTKNLFLWHCGAAPGSLCTTDSTPKINKQYRGDDRGNTLEFPLKTGAVTIGRVIVTPEGEHKIVVFRGEAVEPSYSLRGNWSEVVPEVEADRLLENLFELGTAHHYAVVYGDVTERLKQFAKLMNIELILIS
jgi:L-fucose isomerase-like protein